MNDYSKWDKLQDSDEEQEINERNAASVQNQDAEWFLREQDLVDQWLRKKISMLPKGKGESERPPELTDQTPTFRKVTKEERKVLAMLIVLSHFEEGTTNLDRHPQMLDLVRHHRWLEEDPGTLELLCQVHNQNMKKSDSSGGSGTTVKESDDDIRMRAMCLSGINTLAAPRKTGCTGGLLELVTMICTPANDRARDLRKKWQKKDFAKDAIFDNLFPELRKYREEQENSGGKDFNMKEFWVIAGVVVLLLLVALLVLWGPASPMLFSAPAAAPPPAPLYSGGGHEPEEL